MDLQRIRKYIESVEWLRARTYEKTAPHEYTIRWWRVDLEQDFIDFVLFVRKNGVQEKFYNKTFTYFYLDEHKYWTMGDPIANTWVLNRALVKDYPNNRYKGG